MNLNILRATAIYSGGNIYLYYAELENKNWIFGDEYSFIIVNTNPLENAETFEESSYPEWQQEHLIEEVPDGNHQEILNQIIDAILEGRLVKGWGNYSEAELKSRKTDSSKEQSKNLSNSSALACRIFDCLSDGYDDEEDREETVNALYNELSQLPGDSFLRCAFGRLCEIIEELL